MSQKTTEVEIPLQAEAGPEVQIEAVHQEEVLHLQGAVLPEAVMEHLPAAEAVLLVILPVREEAIPPDGAVDITERKARITRSLPLQVQS